MIQRRKMIFVLGATLAGWTAKMALPAAAHGVSDVDTAPPPDTAPKAKQHAEWLRAVTGKVAAIRPGMTRGDLLKICEGEGGLSTRTQRTYLYRECSCIKVKVAFAPGLDLFNPATPTSSAEADSDVITSISKPYLELITVTD